MRIYEELREMEKKDVYFRVLKKGRFGWVDGFLFDVNFSLV